MSRILLVNNAEPGITEFAEPLIQIVKEMYHTPEFIEYKECLNIGFEDYKGAILTGSPQGDDIVEHHLPYFSWIKSFEHPVLGICAGHHITGYMYHSELLRSREPESGDYLVEIVKEDPLFEGLPRNFKVKQMHNDSITVPEEFELLATSTTCRNQLMKHKERALYTCQFHPEFYNHELIRNFVRLCSR